MRKILTSILLTSIIGFVFQNPGFSQANSVLASGDWIKFGVVETGIYRIDRSFLQSAGLDPGTIDPRNIRLYGNGGGMLPQENNVFRPQDLVENAIHIEGESDGVFNAQDFILFYGTGPDQSYFIEATGELYYENNFYSDTTFYFINIGPGPGKRITSQPSQPTTSPKITSFDDHSIYENDDTQILTPGSGREWYGEQFDLTLSRDFIFEIPGILNNSELRVTSAVAAQSFGPAEFILRLNNLNIGSQDIVPVPQGTYSVKASNSVDTFLVNTNQLNLNGNPLTLNLTYQRNTSERSLGYLNYLVITSRRSLALYGSQTAFRSLESLNNNQSTFSVNNLVAGDRIWEVTNPFEPVHQDFTFNGGKGEFGIETTQLREFFVFRPEGALVPNLAKRVPNQNLRGASVPDMLIITHPVLLNQAYRLANFRAANDNLTVKVVLIEQVYNEFSSGAQDATAIRDYMKYLYDQSPGGAGLKYLLLFGKGSYDYKNLVPNNINQVPIYESRNSLHPIFSYSSDDYFGFLEDDEGFWEESSQGDHTLEIGVGRIPAQSPEEAEGFINKLIRYTTHIKSVGEWRNELVFVADDGDINTHQRDADRISQFVDSTYILYNQDKQYLDAFQQNLTPNGEKSPEANQELNEAVERGALVINFTGHGGETGWTQESILDISTIQEYRNRDRLPLFVTATCEFGRHDDPNRRSGGEWLVINPNGGAIGLITTARPVFSNTNYILSQALFNTLFERNQGQDQRLGDIFKTTKNNSLNGSVNRNFSLLGDPSMKLSYPQEELVLKTINQVNLQDSSYTMKALEKITITGEVVDDDGNLINPFNGIMNVTIYDKPLEKTTLGSDGPSMTFQERTSRLFKGQVSVVDGKYQFQFVVPKNILYNSGRAKFSLYANDSLTDAGGGNTDILIGGSADVPADLTPPTISLYLDDTDFQPGGVTSTRPRLLARLEDENGITISSTGLGQGIIATLDNDQEFILNNYYLADLDDFQRGWVEFQLEDLAPGKHSIRLRVWDTHNNSAEEDLEFFVSEDAKIVLENVINYPNPFSDKTTFRFSHNREGDDLKILISIYSSTGQIITTQEYEFFNSDKELDNMVWYGNNNFSGKIDDGLYIYRLFVQSLSDGAVGEEAKRLVIIK